MFKLIQPNAETIQIDMSSETENIGALTEVVEKFSSHYFPSSQAYNVAVAVDEAVANIMMHAYQNRPDGMIHVILSKNKEDMMIQIEDYSAPFVPPAVVEKKKFTFDKLEAGGLGLYLMQEFMDELRFSYNETEKKNIMVMKKYLLD